MKTITTTAIVALMTAALGLTAIAPAFAQDAAPGQQQAFRQGGPGGHQARGDQGGPGRGGFLDFFGNGNAVEAVEIALVRLSYAIDLTAEQQALFDTLKTDALAAAETFTTATEGLRPTAPAEGETAQRPDISDALETRIAFDTARLAALEAVQPALSAFFDSLTDEQKAELMPQRGERGGMPGGKGGPRHHQGAQQGGPAAPADTPAQPAPPANG